jgi:hypothetical protein
MGKDSGRNVEKSRQSRNLALGVSQNEQITKNEQEFPMSQAAPGLGLATGTSPAYPYGYGCATGTAILTLQGALPVEYLCAGDRIITRNGVRSLSHISMHLQRNVRAVRILSDSLGVGKPADDVLVAADQPILIRDWRAKALFGAAQAMVPAARLIDGTYIRAETVAELRLFALHFDAPAVIFAGGLELACQPALIPA